MQKFRCAVAALSLAILLPAPASASRPLPAARPHRAGQSLDLYSLRARRRARVILQLKLLELRKGRLDRIKSIIEKRLPPDSLFTDRPTL